jgi:phosphohistidine phosphatase
VKRLYVLRHAKSSWNQPDLPDQERPLSGRGRGAAKGMAKHLRTEGLSPSLVLCSSALRARQTLDALAPALPKDTAISVEDGLYGAGAQELLQRLRDVPEPCPSVLLIGHNPAVQELTLLLAGSGKGLDRAATKFPTAALATLEVDSALWSELGPAGAELVAFVVPRDLG